MVQFGDKRGGSRSDSALIAFAHEGTHILLVESDAPKGDQQQQQREGQNGDGKQLQTKAAQNELPGLFHSSVI